MTVRFRAKAGLLILSACLIHTLYLVPLMARDSAASSVSVTATNATHQITPGPMDGKVAYLTASMLERSHYSRKEFNEKVSSQFLDLYLDSLDPQHIHFTQADIAEFEPYRTNLNHLILTENGVGDANAGCVIFNRFLQRLTERTAYAESLLKTDKFDFNSDERITINRKGLAAPKDVTEAKQLWRERLRFEYLQELLGKRGNVKKTASTSGKKSSIVKSPQSAAVKSAVTPVPAVAANASATKSTHRSALQTPKGEEQSSSLHSLAGEASTTTHTATAPTPGITTTTTNLTVVAAPKKSERQEIVDTLSHRYHRNLRYFDDWNSEDVLQQFLTALAHVYDPHSDYFGHAQLEQFAMSMNLGFFGIGAELKMSDDGYCTISRLLPGGPAIKSKQIKDNDRIVAVAQGAGAPVDVVDLSLQKAVQLIRGPKGTEVRLTIIPAGAESSTRTVVSIIRDEIPLEDSAAKAKIIDLPDSHGGTTRLGVIDLPSFYATFDVSNAKDKPEPKSTTTDVARLLKKLEQEKVSGVILDLRRNGGGSLDEAIKLTGLFIKTGPVVQVQREDKAVEKLVDTDPSVLYEGPLVVMTSRGSASASEIVAGALQDYNRALIVGDISTHGKGTVQSVNSLAPLMGLTKPTATNDPGALKLTIKTFFRPGGQSTQLKGVEPDVVLPSVANALHDVGERALDNALPEAKIASAEFEALNLVQPYVAELNRRSGERVATNQEFLYVKEDVARYEKQYADKTVSLNEAFRLKENEETAERDKARNKERLSRHAPSPKVYEITLKQVDLPGLPPPVGSTNTATSTVTGTPDGSAKPVEITKTATADGEADEVAEPKPPAIDATLEETERILLDYLSLLPKGNLVTVGH